MKKFKTKLGAFLLATSLLGGAIVSCGKQPTPTPQVLKYFVNVNSDPHFTTEGINIEGYEQGTTVRFKVNMTDDAWELVRVVLNGTQLTPDLEGYYSFTMPADDVDVNVVVRKKDVWTLEFTPALKKGFESTVTAKLNDVVKLVTLEAVNHKVEFNADFTKATAVDDGAEQIIVTFGGAAVKTFDVTIATPEHGELITDPLNPKEANEKAAALTDKTRSSIEYYVEGTVDAGLLKQQGDDDPYVTFDMKEDNKTFKIYCANYGEGTSQDQLDYGSKVMTHGKLYHFGSTMEMSPSNIVSIDNTTPVKVMADKALVMLAPGAQSEDLGVRIAPRGSSEAEITATSSDNEVATFADGKVTAGTKLGSATITFSATDLPSYEVKVIVSDDIHEGTEEDPLPAEQAWQMANALENLGKSDTEYYIEGVVSEIQTKSEKTSGQTEAAWGYATWKLKTNKTPFTIYSLDLSKAQYEALEVGAKTLVKAKLYHYNSTMETSGGSVISVDNTKVTTLVLDKTQAMAVKGDELVLTPSLLPASAASTANLVWSSDNTEAVTVDGETGDITLVTAGIANVTVTDTVSGLSASCKVTVTNNPMVMRPVREGEFTVGEEYYLGLVLGDDVVYANGEMDGYYLAGQTDIPEVKAKLVNAAEADGDYKYNLLLNDQYVLCYATPDDSKPEEWHTNIGLTSDATDERIALVQYDAQGRLSVKGWNKTAEEASEEHSRVQMWIGNQKNKTYTSFSYRNESELNNAANFYILTEADTLTGISLNQTSLNLNGLGVKSQLVASPNPSTAVLRGLKWRSENGAVATVTQDGEVETVAVGETKIVAYIEGSDPEIKAECNVTVTNYELDNVEYVYTDWSTTAGKQTVVHDPISVEISNGIQNANNKDFRVYKNATLKITSEHLITKIEMTSSGGSNGVDQFGSISGWTVASAKSGTWEGGSNSITFTASGAQVRLTKLVIYFVK